MIVHRCDTRLVLPGLIALVLGIAMPGGAGAITIDGNGLPFGGDATALDLGSELDAIGRVEILGNGSLGTCSGTLISPTAVLTADHCFRDDDGNLTDATAGFSTTVTFPTGPAAVTATVETIETFGAASFGAALTNGSDIAVLTLAQAVDGIEPLALFDGPLIQESVTIAGFGLAGDEVSGATGAVDGQRRAATNTLDAALGVVDAEGNDGLLLFTDFDTGAAGDNLIGGATPITDSVLGVVEGSPAPGDSGGPLLVGRSGDLLIAGVVSAGQGVGDIISGAGSLAIYTSVVDGAARAFVDAFAAPAASTPVPLPPSLALMLAGLGALRLRAGRA